MRVAVRLGVLAAVVVLVVLVATVVGGGGDVTTGASSTATGSPAPTDQSGSPGPPGSPGSPGQSRSPGQPESSGSDAAAPARSLDPVAWCLPQRSTIDGSSLVLASPRGGAAVTATWRPLRDRDHVTSAEVAAGTAVARRVEPATDALEVGADDPLVVGRVSTFPRGPAGTIAGPCPSRLVAEAVVPGMATADGSTALVAIGNPSDAEVAVALDLLTPAGREVPEYHQYIPIAPGATTIVFADDPAPDREDLAVRVRAEEGRVAVSAMRQALPGDDGIAGRTWVVAPEAPETTWTLPWIATAGDPAAGLGATSGDGDATEQREATAGRGGPAATTTLWVANPGSAPAEVTVDLLTAEGRVPRAAELPPVPGDGVVGVDLGPALAALSGDVGAVVTTRDDARVVVAVGTDVVAGATSERTGITTVTGHREAAASWVLVGPGGPSRRQLVTVANPGGTTAVVDVAVSAGAGTTPVAPPTGLSVAPGATTSLEVPAPSRAGPVAVFVTATEGAVSASLRSGTDAPAPLDLVHVTAARPGG